MRAFAVGLVICASSIGWAGVATSAPATQPRAVVPSASALTAAKAQLNEITSRATKQYDSAALLRLAEDTTTSSPLRYAAALRAMELATRGRDMQQAMAARDKLVEWYEYPRREHPTFDDLDVEGAKKNLAAEQPQVVQRMTAQLEKIRSDGRSRP